MCFPAVVPTQLVGPWSAAEEQPNVGDAQTNSREQGKGQHQCPPSCHRVLPSHVLHHKSQTIAVGNICPFIWDMGSGTGGEGKQGCVSWWETTARSD